MKTLTREPNDQHRVDCDRCGFSMLHADVRDAVDNYVNHECEVDQ